MSLAVRDPVSIVSTSTLESRVQSYSSFVIINAEAPDSFLTVYGKSRAVSSDVSSDARQINSSLCSSQSSQMSSGRFTSMLSSGPRSDIGHPSVEINKRIDGYYPAYSEDVLCRGWRLMGAIADQDPEFLRESQYIDDSIVQSGPFWLTYLDQSFISQFFPLVWGMPAPSVVV